MTTCLRIVSSRVIQWKRNFVPSWILLWELQVLSLFLSFVVDGQSFTEPRHLTNLRDPSILFSLWQLSQWDPASQREIALRLPSMLLWPTWELLHMCWPYLTNTQLILFPLNIDFCSLTSLCLVESMTCASIATDSWRWTCILCDSFTLDVFTP